jgi:hypothetical protein
MMIYEYICTVEQKHDYLFSDKYTYMFSNKENTVSKPVKNILDRRRFKLCK